MDNRKHRDIVAKWRRLTARVGLDFVNESHHCQFCKEQAKLGLKPNSRCVFKKYCNRNAACRPPERKLHIKIVRALQNWSEMYFELHLRELYLIRIETMKLKTLVMTTGYSPGILSYRGWLPNFGSFYSKPAFYHTCPSRRHKRSARRKAEAIAKFIAEQKAALACCQSAQRVCSL